MEIVIFILVVAGCGVVGHWVGRQKGCGVAGFWLGAAAGPLGWIVAAVLPSPPRKDTEFILRRPVEDPVDAWEMSQSGPPAPKEGWRERLEADGLEAAREDWA